MRALPLRRLIPIALALVVLPACATSRLVNQWSDPGYRAARLDTVLVVGVSGQPALRRRFEDEFVAALAEEGVRAEPSYRYMPEPGPADQARIADAVTRAAADAVIVTRLVRVDRQTEVVPAIHQPSPAMRFGLYPGYSAAWLGYYDPPRVRQYDVFVSETTLYDVPDDRLVWTGTVRTPNPGNIDREIRRYVDLVVEALRKQQIL
jgi:hypothetical protein